MLLEFQGTECSHCRAMDQLVSRLEKEERVKLDKFEVWHSEINAQKMMEYDRGFCGGVPFFFNTVTKKWICGETSYAALKEWALGK